VSENGNGGRDYAGHLPRRSRPAARRDEIGTDMTQQGDDRQRWDTDDRFHGVADGAAFAAPIDELADLARRPDWIAEEPDLHLAPHLRDVEASGAPGLRLVRTTCGADGVLTVELEGASDASYGEIRRRAWMYIGAIAELATSVRERRDGDQTTFDVVTGVPDDGGRFASHGHTVRLVVRPPASGSR
jgi:hypothetical protein